MIFMKTEDVYKALAELFEKKKEEFHMTNAELAEKLYGVLDTCLDDDVKNTGYGDNGEYWSFEDFDHEIKKPDTKRDYESIFDYCYGVIVHGILNFCGCGCGIRVSGLIRTFLECFDSYDGTLFDSDIYKQRFPGRTDTEMEFMLKWVDSLGFSEHGCSVYGSWLTDKGIMLRELLRKMDISYEIRSEGNV